MTTGHDTPETPTVPVSVHLTVKVGDLVKEFDVVAVTDTAGFLIADGILAGLRDDARNWLYDAKGML